MISIILPSYNESKVIADVISDIKFELNKMNSDYEIIVINDSSTDDTEKIALQLGVKVITHPYNIGNGAAIKTGVRNCNAV